MRSGPHTNGDVVSESSCSWSLQLTVNAVDPSGVSVTVTVSPAVRSDNVQIPSTLTSKQSLESGVGPVATTVALTTTRPFPVSKTLTSADTGTHVMEITPV